MAREKSGPERFSYGLLFAFIMAERPPNYAYKSGSNRLTCGNGFPIVKGVFFFKTGLRFSIHIKGRQSFQCKDR
jgi:hypothetical protein